MPESAKVKRDDVDDPSTNVLPTSESETCVVTAVLTSPTFSTPSTTATISSATINSSTASATADPTIVTPTNNENSNKSKSATVGGNRSGGSTRRGCKLIEAKSKRTISPTSSTDTTISSSSSSAAVIVGGSSSRQSAALPSGNQSNSCSSGGDSLFEPSVEMMVNDFDDERTLEEEEALAATEAEDPSAELSSLQRERDMPIEELLALYNCRGRTQVDSIDDGSSLVGEDTNRPRSSTSLSSQSDENDVDDEEVSDLRKLYPETFKSGVGGGGVGTGSVGGNAGNTSGGVISSSAGDQRHLRTLSRPQSEEEEEDEDYSPDEDDFKKTIMVGSEFQAVIPEELCKYGDALPYENEDKLVWDPSRLLEHDVIVYQQKSTLLCNNQQQQKQSQSITNSTTSVQSATVAAAIAAATTVTSLPIGAHLRDDEQKLYLLLQCGHNVDEALRRRQINAAVTDTTSMSQWSEDECRNFENGLRIYGKDFHTIQQLKVKTRSVGELVQFYYLWKKTERHDVFANKARLDKKKYSLHPGLTDYMDRFLEEQECNGGNGGGSGGGGNILTGNMSSIGHNVSGNMMIQNTSTGGDNGTNNSYRIGIRERSSSPNVNNCLMYSTNNYRRRQQHHQQQQQQRYNNTTTATSINIDNDYKDSKNDPLEITGSNGNSGIIIDKSSSTATTSGSLNMKL